MKNNYVALKVKGKRIDEHRKIMQEFLGRKLNFNEIVHHINGNKKDNKLKNLKLMSRSEHSKISMLGKKNRLGFRTKIKGKLYYCPFCKKWLEKTMFHLAKKKASGVYTYCKRCRINRIKYPLLGSL